MEVQEISVPTVVTIKDIADNPKLYKIVVLKNYTFTHTSERNRLCCGHGHVGCTFSEFPANVLLNIHTVIVPATTFMSSHYTSVVVGLNDRQFEIPLIRLQKCIKEGIFVFMKCIEVEEYEE